MTLIRLKKNLKPWYKQPKDCKSYVTTQHGYSLSLAIPLSVIERSRDDQKDA